MLKGNDSPSHLRVVQVVMAYTVATAAMLGAFWACPNVAWMQWLLVAGVGFTLYGPQMLIGLCGAEVVPKASVSAANGMLGWISYLGALALPFGLAFALLRYAASLCDAEFSGRQRGKA